MMVCYSKSSKRDGLYISVYFSDGVRSHYTFVPQKTQREREEEVVCQ